MGGERTDSGVLDSVGQRDILIAVVGNAGVGKSTFINTAAAVDTLPIDQASKIDNEVQYVICSKPELYQDRKIVFLDIPAFDSESDEQAIQNKLRHWLRVVISRRLNISGVLYLHRATEAEFSGASLMHLTSLITMFEELSQSPIGVLLVLTMQAHLGLLTRLQRKKVIQEKWNTLFSLGASQSTRFEDSSYSAWEVLIDLIIYSDALAKQSNPLRSIVSATCPTTSIDTQPDATGSGESLKRRLALLGLAIMEYLPAPLLSTHAIDNFRSGFVPERQKVTPEKADGPEVNVENPKRLSSPPTNDTSTNGPKQASQLIKNIDEKGLVALPHSMSKPSTARPFKNPSVRRPSAWSRGPPQSPNSPSHSQLPAPTTTTVQTHSHRPSVLSGVSIKDGVSVYRNSIPAAEQGSVVMFGSISVDDVSAPILFSPATAPSIKSEGVKSPGTLEADSHVNGKSALSSRPSVAVPPSTTSFSTPSPAVSVTAPAPATKLAKTDTARLFRNPSSAPSSQPASDTSSPSLRTAGLPPSLSQSASSSQPIRSSAPSQPSQLGSHGFTPYRHPQSGASGTPRSPAYSTRQVANGSGPRSQGGPNDAPSQMNAGMSSARLAPMPHNGQPSGMPPPPQMQPPMAQQMPVPWSYYSYPGMQEGYYPQPAWYSPAHHPPPGGPHGPPHGAMPISPRNSPMPLQSARTPTSSHATANPVHPPHPPPMTHPSTSMGSISSPPPTPSTASSRLYVKSSAFVPTRPKVTLKKADGTEVNIKNLKQPSSSPANNASTNGPSPSNYRQSSPGTLSRRGVRLETPEQRDRRLADEERAKSESTDKLRKEKEALERKQKEVEEKKRREEEELGRKEEEEEKERIRKEEEEREWIRKEAEAIDVASFELADRRVRGLLNELTMELFDPISDRIIERANKSKDEEDGRSLIQIIRLVVEKATDGVAWPEMCARLCRKMKEQISDQMQADGIRGPEGKPMAGGQLFQRYLLKRCQEDFKRYWLAKEATAVDAATKATEGDATKAVNEKNKEGGDQEAVLYSNEYYATQKAKRQGPGLIKFIGELFKLQMITERIMHECLQKLLADVNSPEEEVIESLCQLLTAAGSLLDTRKARAHVDVYFMRMKELIRSPKVGPRMQSMLQDVIKLRERGWVTGNGDAQEEERLQRQINVSPGGSRDGDDAARSPFEAVDLSSSGETYGEARPPTMFRPGSVFAGTKTVGKCDSLSRASSNLSMFSVFQNASSGADEAPEPQPMRKRLVLLPRSKPIEQTKTQQQENSEIEEASTPAAPAEMSEAVADKRVRECSKEFFGIRNLDEAEVYFTDLPAQYHHKLVDELVSAAVESTEANAQLVSDLFTRAVSKSLCSPASFEEGVTPVAEVIDDITIDVPKAFRLFAIMIKGAMFDGERRSRLASWSMDSDKLLGLLS